MPSDRQTAQKVRDFLSVVTAVCIQGNRFPMDCASTSEQMDLPTPLPSDAHIQLRACVGSDSILLLLAAVLPGKHTLASIV